MHNPILQGNSINHRKSSQRNLKYVESKNRLIHLVKSITIVHVGEFLTRKIRKTHVELFLFVL